MPKASSIQRYKQTLQKQINFSFSQPKQSTFNKCQPLQTLIDSQKRSLGMWVNTVLELHRQQFLHALKHCRKYSIGQLNKYMLRYYSHLKAMIRFYIIATLIDYEEINEKDQQNPFFDKECVFLNIAIEQLTRRFFRQSQWLHKISHHASFILFSIFDPFLRGYTTIKDLNKITQNTLLSTKQNIPKRLTSQKKNKKLKYLLKKKLFNNIQGQDHKIYQQNFEEILLRANLLNFQEIFASSKDLGGSKRYHNIQEVIIEYEKREKEKQQKLQAQYTNKNQNDKQQLGMLTQDYEIKQKSQMMSRKQYLSDIYPRTQRKQFKSTCFEDAFASTPDPFSQNKKSNNSYISLTEEKHPYTQTKNKSYSNLLSFYPQTEGSKSYNQSKQNRSALQNYSNNQTIFRSIHQLQKKKCKLVVKELILRQLQVIKQEKKKVHLQYLNYL